MNDSITISDRWRSPIVAQKRADGIVLRTSAAWLILSSAELDRLFAFATNRPHIQRYPVAPKQPLNAPQTV